MQVYGSVEDIPEDTLKQLGWIISGITADDFYNISISDIDTVSVFGIYRNLSLQQVIIFFLFLTNVQVYIRQKKKISKYLV